MNSSTVSAWKTSDISRLSNDDVIVQDDSPKRVGDVLDHGDGGGETIGDLVKIPGLRVIMRDVESTHPPTHLVLVIDLLLDVLLGESESLHCLVHTVP